MKGFWPASLVVLLVGCVTATRSTGDAVSSEPYVFATYEVRGPQGGWGVIKCDAAAEEIRFGRVAADLSGDDFQWTFISVARRHPEAGRGESVEGAPEEPLADLLLTFLERRLAEEGKRKKAFEVKSASRGIDTVGGKRVYFVRYVLDYSFWEVGMKSGNGAFLLHFPPDWRSRQAFYVFEIRDTWRTGNQPYTPDLRAIDPVVASLATR
jgi:hypothetical protein